VSADDVIHVLAAKDAIRETLYLYCVGSDRMDTEMVESVFHPDAKLNYGYFEGGPTDLTDFSAKFLRRFTCTHHSLTNVLIRVDGDAANALSYITALHVNGKRKDGSAYDMIGYGRYIDLFERRAGSWRIAKRTVVFDGNVEIPDSFAWPERFSQYRGRRDPHDPAYAVLAPQPPEAH
jgi:SnoaL-like domain